MQVCQKLSQLDISEGYSGFPEVCLQSWNPATKYQHYWHYISLTGNMKLPQVVMAPAHEWDHILDLVGFLC